MKYLYPINDIKRSALWLFLLLLTGSFTPVRADDPFVPGAGGAMPTFPVFQPLEGKVGGFMVYSSVRNNNFFGTGTHAVVDMSFPDAAAYGAESIVLQYKKTDGSWANFMNYETEITTTGNNFSLDLYQTYTFRLLLRGGANSGYVSNEQTADLAMADTYFNQVTLDESMFLTGVMAPWVGRGLQVSYVVRTLSDNSVVSSGLSYQWYRVNPVTYEQILIPGADSLLYATTTADVGYRMLVVATGNQTTAGGFYKMMSGQSIVSPNKCFVTNPSTSGFTLNVYKDVAKLDTGDFVLRDKDYAIVPITAVTKSPTNGVFQIAAPLSLEKNPYRLENKSNFWKICTEMHFGPMSDLMVGASIDLAVSALGEMSAESVLNMVYEASGNKVRFESTSMVKEVSMYSLTGTLMNNWKIGQFESDVSVGNITPGVYVMRFAMEKGTVVKKVMVTK